MSHCRQDGLSLIELMVTIGIFALISMAGLSFTGSWFANIRINEGRDQLFQAFSRAKALALRNPAGITGDAPVSVICLNTQGLSIKQRQSTSTSPCLGPAAWSTDINASLALKVDGAVFACACLNNKGRLTTSDCSQCISSTTITLSSGGEQDDFIFF